MKRLLLTLVLVLACLVAVGSEARAQGKASASAASSLRTNELEPTVLRSEPAAGGASDVTKGWVRAVVSTLSSDPPLAHALSL